MILFKDTFCKDTFCKEVRSLSNMRFSDLVWLKQATHRTTTTKAMFY